MGVEEHIFGLKFNPKEVAKLGLRNDHDLP